MCFVHRDFHASNIMVKNKKFGLIDSQDALEVIYFMMLRHLLMMLELSSR